MIPKTTSPFEKLKAFIAKPRVLFHGSNNKVVSQNLTPSQTTVAAASDGRDKQGAFVMATCLFENAVNFAFSPKKVKLQNGKPVRTKFKSTPVHLQFYNSRNNKVLMHGLICRDLDSYLKNLNKEAEIFVLPQKQFRQVKNAKGKKIKEWIAEEPTSILHRETLKFEDALANGLQIFYAKDRDQSIEQLEQLAKDLGKASSSIPVLKEAVEKGILGHYNQDLFVQGNENVNVFDFKKLIKPGLLNSIVNKAAKLLHN